METIRKINDDLAISGQITIEQLPQIAEDGFKSILNLRSTDEPGVLLDEESKAEQLGLDYTNLPFKVETVSDETIIRVLQQIHRLPKPVLVHCDNAIRAAAISLMYISTRQGATLEEAFSQANRLGLFGVLSQA